MTESPISLTALPDRGAVFWPVGTGDSTTVVIDDDTVLQVDLHDMNKADDDATPEVPVVDRLVEGLPTKHGRPYLAVFALTHADKDHCLGFADLLDQVHIGELWSTPRLWREYNDPDVEDPCEDASAFREESERRIEATRAALAAGTEPISGDRILVIGHDDESGDHPYADLPDRFKSGPGQAITSLDGEDCSGRLEAFFHAPFNDDCAAPRNETSLAMQITLIHPSGTDGRLLLLGDLSHDTIVKIFDYSEHHDRSHYLAWDLLLAPHHCSKRVMYVPDEQGADAFEQEVMSALERHERDGAAVVSSSAVLPSSDTPGANPPHRKAADRYMEITETFVCTMQWGSEQRPSPVVFGVDASGAGIVPLEPAEKASLTAVGKSLQPAPSRMAAVAAAAVRLAESLPRAPADQQRGPDRVRQAVQTDRGDEAAPDVPVGFGR